jgi:hypothetical protein
MGPWFQSPVLLLIPTPQKGKQKPRNLKGKLFKAFVFHNFPPLSWEKDRKSWYMML